MCSDHESQSAPVLFCCVCLTLTDNPVTPSWSIDCAQAALRSGGVVSWLTNPTVIGRQLQLQPPTGWHKHQSSNSHLDLQLSNSPIDPWSICWKLMRDCYCPGQGRWVWVGSINDALWEIDVISCGGEESPVVLLCYADLCVCWRKKEESSFHFITFKLDILSRRMQ